MVSAPSFAFSHRVVEAYEPVLVRAFRPELVVEKLHVRVIRRLSRAAEVERDVAGALSEMSAVVVLTMRSPPSAFTAIWRLRPIIRLPAS